MFAELEGYKTGAGERRHLLPQSKQKKGKVPFLNQSKFRFKFAWGIVAAGMKLGGKNLEEAPR